MKTYRLRRMRKIVSIMLCMVLLFSGSTWNCTMANAESGEAVTDAYAADGYVISHQITAAWEGGYNADITITNTSDKKIENWKINLIPAEGNEIISIWNAAKKEIVAESGKTAYQISNVGWNQDIAVGDSITFGYQAACKKAEAPKEIYLIGQAETAEKSTYQVVYRTTDVWQGGYIIEAAIQNLTDKDMEDWEISFTWEGVTITKVWNAIMAAGENGSYRVENDTYNSIIPAGKSVTFSMMAETDAKEITFPEKAVLIHHGSGEGEGILPEVTTTPAVTATPGAALEEPEVTEEMRRWNRTMMHMDAEEVQKAIANVESPIKTAILDSGVDEMPEIAIAGRKNLLSDDEDMSEMYEDATGHGTALAALMVFDRTEEQEEDINTDEGYIYEYYTDDWTYSTDDEDEEDTKDTDISEENEDEDSDDDGTVGLGKFIEKNQADFTGINPGMELYSVQVLDEQNEAPVSRIIEGIEWAVENDIKILNISVGMEKDNEKLHKAIKKAYEAGILIVAAAGNKGEIQYPAAYEEVIAVGSVDYTGSISIEEEANSVESATRSAISAKSSSSCIELAAPGEGVLSVGAFGIETEVSGTSMAAGEVSAIASILWQQDTSVSSHFIRELLRVGANKNNEEAGYGIVDCEYSLAIYDEFKEAYEEDKKADTQNTADKTMDEKELSEFMDEVGIEENAQELDTVENITDKEEPATEDTVSANWGGKGHLKLLKYENGEELEECLKALRVGIRLQDGAISGLNSKTKYPAWHGYYKDYEDKKNGITRSGNYIAGYLYLSALAESIFNTKEEVAVAKDYDVRGTVLDKSQMNGVIQIDGIHANGGKKADTSWETILKCKLGIATVGAIDTGSVKPKEKIKDKKANRALIVYGMAMHTMSDTFAHSCKGCKEEKNRCVWGNLKNTASSSDQDSVKKKEKYNDRKKIRKERYKATRQAAYNALDHIRLTEDKQEVGKIKAGKVKDFCSRAFVVGAENTECEDIINVNDYLSGQKDFGEYLKEGFGVKNIYDYAKSCGAGKKTLAYLKRIDFEKIKAKIDKRNIRIFILTPQTTGVKSLAAGDIQERADITVMSVKNNKETVIANVRGDADDTAYIILSNDFSQGKSYKIKYSHPNMTATFRITEETSCKAVSLAEDEEVMIKEWELEAEEGVTVNGRILEVKADGSYGEAVEDAKVTIRRQGEDASRAVSTDAKGKYRFGGCTPGMYVVSVKGKGYQTVKQKLYLSGRQEQYQNLLIKLLPDDATGTGNAKGCVKDSFTKAGIEGLTLHIRKGINEQQGDILQTVYTERGGSYSIENLPAGYYCAEVVDGRSEKEDEDKYIATRFNIFIMPDKTIGNQNATVTKYMEEDQMQIVLSWGNTTREPNAFLEVYNLFCSINSWLDHMQIIEKGKLLAEMNEDVESPYGVETINIYDISDMYFEYNVGTGSGGKNGTELALGDLCVQVYYKGILWEEFYAPLEKGGAWRVFQYDAKEDKIITINSIC